MKYLTIFCIVCLVTVGMAAAAGTVPAVQAVRNISTVSIPAVNAPQQEDVGFVQTIINPIVRYIPGMNSPENTRSAQTQVVQPSNKNLVEILPAPTQAAQPVTKNLYEISSEKFVTSSKTASCTGNEKDTKIFLGKMYSVLVSDYDPPLMYGVIRPSVESGIPSDIVLLTDNLNMLTQIHTALITGNDVTVVAFPVSNPPSSLSNFEVYRLCQLNVKKL